MKYKKSRLVSIMLFVSMVCSLLLQNITVKPSMAYAEEHQTSAEITYQKHTIWVLGDSIAASFTDQYYYPRYGWGTQLQRFIDSSRYEVVNLALSGRSSKSYVNNDQYKVFLNNMKEGDVVFVAFGHNDEKSEKERYTNPNRSHLFVGSFQNMLYQNYIVPAQKKGCSVILCTPFVRRPQKGEWEASDLHITSDVGSFEGGDYPQAIRELGKTLNIPVVDLTSMSKEVYDSIGYEDSVYLNSWTSEKSRSVDNTHTNIWGAAYNAYLISKSIYEMKVPGISEAIKPLMVKTPPRKETYLKSNPNYVISEYNSNIKDSELWSKVGIWNGTVFGNIGDINSVKNNFIIESYNKNGLHLAALNNTGRIGTINDGIAMYYCRIPAGCDFTLTANAKVNRYVEDKQVSFGLMVRDEMYVDQYTLDSLGDFVATAPLVSPKDNSLWNCYARKDGLLLQGESCESKIAEGDQILLKLQGSADGFSTSLGQEAVVSGGFDFPLTELDPNYVYVGMFVTRNADVIFENIHLTIDGVEVNPANYTTLVSQPEYVPEVTPTPVPTKKPTVTPTPVPTKKPTVTPTPVPTKKPTVTPTPVPTKKPTVTPTPVPEKTNSTNQRPASVTGIQIVSNESGEMTVSWKKANVTGYQIAVAKDSKFTKDKLLCGINNGKEEQHQFSLYELKSNQTYYVKIRSYKIVNGKREYGKFSSVSKIKIK